MASAGIIVPDGMRKQVAATRHLPLMEDSREARYMCHGCGRDEECDGPPSFLKCDRCKAVHYCNKSCQKQDWTKGGVGTSSSAVQNSPRIERLEFQESPHGKVVRTQVFPWANFHHKSGAFFINDFLERRGLFGQEGFWARTVGLGDDRNGWCHGQMLLKESLPSIKEGWISLKDEEISSGDAVSATEALRLWAQYCKHRNIASSSIAPNLLADKRLVNVSKQSFTNLSFTKVDQGMVSTMLFTCLALKVNSTPCPWLAVGRVGIPVARSDECRAPLHFSGCQASLKQGIA